MLNVVIENSGTDAILHCSGSIVAGEETSTLLSAVESLRSGRVVVLDLTGVSGIDARGLGALVAVKQWALDVGVVLVRPFRGGGLSYSCRDLGHSLRNEERLQAAT